MTLNIPEQAEHLLRARMITVEAIEVIGRAVIARLHVIVASPPDADRAALFDLLTGLNIPDQPTLLESIDAAHIEDVIGRLSGAPPHVVVLLRRLDDGSTRVASITEIGGDGALIPIFEFEQTGVEAGKVIGRLRPTGLRPSFVDRLEAAGLQMPSYRGGIRIPPQDTDS